jgi:hypothetical protein
MALADARGRAHAGEEEQGGEGMFAKSRKGELELMSFVQGRRWRRLGSLL